MPMGRPPKYMTQEARKIAKRERQRKLPLMNIYLGKVVPYWNEAKKTTGVGRDATFAKILLDRYLGYNKINPGVVNETPMSTDPKSLQDGENQVLPMFKTIPLDVKQEESCGTPPPNYTATVESIGDNANGPVSSGHPATTVATPLDMSCDTIYQVTMVLNLESDWKCPVVVSLTNATVSSSDMIGSTSHKVKVINSQTLELTSVTANDSRMEAGDLGKVSEVDLAQMTDLVVELSSDDAPSECSGTPGECSYTSMKDDDIEGWKDDPNKDPDWDPDNNSDVITRRPAKKPRESSGSDRDDMMTMSCQVCSFRTSLQWILTSHVTKKHYEEASLSGLRMCRQCGKVEDSIESLHEHRETTHGGAEMEKKHKCPVCHKVFTSFTKYMTHLAGHELKHKCTKCKQACLTAEALRRHIGSVHRTVSQKKHLNLVCELCGHQESGQKALEEHQTMKHGIDFGKRFSCCECNQVFQTNTQLRNHVQYHHQLLNPLECDMCGKFFKQETSLRGHIQNIHLQTKLKPCPHCGKSFTTKSRLNMHVNTVHLKLRQLPCPWPGCAKSFGSNWHLQVHMYIHNDEKPLGCPHCDFRARQRHSLDYHLERHHKDLATTQKENEGIGNGLISPETAINESVVGDQIAQEQTIS